MIECLGTLELRDQRNVHRPRLGQQLPRLPQIRRALHEAERHQIDAGFDAELEIGDVLLRDRWRAERHPRRVDPFPLADVASLDDGRRDLAAVG